MPYKDPIKQREYQRQWMIKRRESFIGDKSCVKCGSTKDLEIDHVNPATKISHRIWSWSNKKRGIELSKCQILCKNCHSIKSANALRKESICGTCGAYRKGCRCDLCKAVSREYKRRYRRGERPGSITATRTSTNEHKFTPALTNLVIYNTI